MQQEELSHFDYSVLRKALVCAMAYLGMLIASWHYIVEESYLSKEVEVLHQMPKATNGSDGHTTLLNLQ